MFRIAPAETIAMSRKDASREPAGDTSVHLSQRKLGRREVCARSRYPLAPVASVEVVVDQTRRLHEQVHAAGADEPPAAPFQISRERP
jgi:hypothetical protein